MRNLWLIFVTSSFGRRHIPSYEIVSESYIMDHPGYINGRDGNKSSLIDAYAYIVNIQLRSLLESITTGESFHLDGLVYSLNNSRNILSDNSEFSKEAWHGGPLTCFDYSRLISLVTRDNKPGINKGLTSAQSLRQFSSDFRTNFDILYVDNIFDEWTLEQLNYEADRLWKSEDIEPNCNLNGIDRLGGYIHHSDSFPLESHTTNLYSLIYANEPLMLWASAVVGENLFASDFPIELREYGNNSKGMGCHADIQMYRNVSLNIEVVVTLSNHGKCEVSWYDRENVRHSVWPRPNSITLVKPNAAVHCVSNTLGGFREILKFILVGDYRKHPNFSMYVDNRCSGTNSNVKMLGIRREERRSEPKLDVDSSSLVDEL